MTAILLDGKALAAEIQGELAVEAARLREQTGVQPGLAVMLVGAGSGQRSVCAQQAAGPVNGSAWRAGCIGCRPTSRRGTCCS